MSDEASGLDRRVFLGLVGGGASVLGMATDAAGARVISDLGGFRAQLRAIALARAETQGTARNTT